MFSDITSVFLLLLAISVIACFIVAYATKEKELAPLFKSKRNPTLQFSQAATPGYPPALIERPILDLDEHTTITIEREKTEDPRLEMIEDEETALLKAAEVIVEKVQDIVNKIASNPPNPEEVFTKIRSIVSQYRIFDNTEYFDAINSFIAVTVERDCNIKFTKDQLLALWV